MNKRALRLVTAFAFLMLLAPASALAQDQEYPALEGVTSVDTVFDFRVGDADTALAHLALIHSMVDDPSMAAVGAPEIVVVFIGPSVNLISSEGNEAAARRLGAKISEMEADGVRFEVCMTTAHALDISAESILPEVRQVGNGWISLIGYQHNDYAVIADF